MGFFKVMLLGKKIKLKCEDSEIIGFYKVRKVWAGNPKSAVERAKKLVCNEWKKGHYLEQNKGEYPALSVDSVDEYYFLSGLFAKVPRKGFTFYSEE